MKFPIKIFEDIKGTDFSKHNKKQVTEDYVAQNFYECGWSIYRPFNDTGIDIIAIKKVCPNGHTGIFEKTFELYNCKTCNSDFIHIHRFIQVKTREVKGDDDKKQFFGYTLKSKDFRTDPRHVFLLYSDATDEFLIIPMFEYLKIFHNTSLGKSHFGTPSFRKGNNKVNNLKRNISGDWEWSGVSFMPFLNEKGLELISSPQIDINLNSYIEQVTKMKFDLFYDYSRGRQTDEDTEIEIKEILKNKVEYNLKNIAKQRDETKNLLDKKLDKTLKEGINGYLIKFKELLFK